MAKTKEHKLALGTKKGLFILTSPDRRRWKTRGPFLAGLEVYDAAFDGSGSVWGAVTSYHWGPTVHRSVDNGAKWTRRAGPKYSKESGLSVARIWNVTPGLERDELWAGVEPAGLFHSTDAGQTWGSVDGINQFPGRDKWMPGGGGLCLHTILPYPEEPKRMIVGASAVGVFGSGDAGATWRLMNAGIHSEMLPGGATGEDQPGSCVHKMVRDPQDPDLLYMQNHWGIYRRRRGDEEWTSIAKGLPSTFGFGMAAHPHDAGTVYTVPLEADSNRVASKGAFAVYRTRDAGKRWQRLTKGLPQKDAWFTVLREGVTTDDADPAGVYVGTTTGHLYGSRDDGDSWHLIASTLPPILSVDAYSPK